MAVPVPGVVSPHPDELASAVKQRLVTGDVDGARELFGDLVTACQRRAIRLAWYYLRDSAEVDEAVQDAFVRAYQHMADYREDAPFEPWLTRILVNACLDRVKARRRRWVWQTHEDAGRHAPAPRTSDPEAQATGVLWRQAVDEALTGLPDRQRLVFTLCQVQGWSVRDVATQFGMKESTVRVHLFRALRSLRAALEEWRT